MKCVDTPAEKLSSISRSVYPGGCVYRVADSAPCVHNNKMTHAVITENGARNDVGGDDKLPFPFLRDDDDRFFRCRSCFILIDFLLHVPLQIE